ncbi:PREDICTED: uncharacterized protein LOC106292920 isoform X3 [Brassica oleracea var. oleracea]|uniref:uncharacterized protein LOC106292920 isoform X3 n=1 Tax=Brassica oleracea var. oleracea TaxID=109376 RepID=UPI0006A6A210|nr:PREDICTED: uncharacterized protein LOC106292920 isoform X3 [Brassica oleracea var. oleracea]XP_013584043.1 PREDICTED: uncharacterized protein LOC106292920 isoform X3 [Brassica oleracea var. oleracea]
MMSRLPIKQMTIKMRMTNKNEVFGMYCIQRRLGEWVTRYKNRMLKWSYSEEYAITRRYTSYGICSLDNQELQGITF